jgi:hypothetical protein
MGHLLFHLLLPFHDFQLLQRLSGLAQGLEQFTTWRGCRSRWTQTQQVTPEKWWIFLGKMVDLPGKNFEHGGFTREKCWIFLGKMEDFPGKVVDFPFFAA